MAEQGESTMAPIAARERGPGPGRYGLPSSCGYMKHDFTKHMKPAYTMRPRYPANFKDECSPGPMYHPNSRITRKGLDGTPSYSIQGHQKDQTTFRTPAPGAYSPEKAHPQGERHAPVYSMGARTRYRKRDTNPSPNSYSLPSLTGNKIPNKYSSSCYSMTGRAKTGGFSEDLAKTPGPGRYDTTDPSVTKTKRPAYTMGPRSFMPGDATQKPGPGAHSPEKVYVNKPKAPSFPMGIRHSEFITPLIIDVSD